MATECLQETARVGGGASFPLAKKLCWALHETARLGKFSHRGCRRLYGRLRDPGTGGMENGRKKRMMVRLAP